MDYTSVNLLINAHILSQVRSTKIDKLNLYLSVSSTSPLLFRDTNRIELTGPKDLPAAVLDKIRPEMTVCLGEVTIKLDYGKDATVTNC